MAGGTPDWSALASENERFLAEGAPAPSGSSPAALWQASGEQVASATHATTG